MEKVLITGITGFVGSHLAELLLSRKDYEVYGTIRHNRSPTVNIDHIMDKIRLESCDLTDASSIDRVVREVRPDYIFHLAAQSYVPYSWKNPNQTLTNNSSSTLNLFEAVIKAKIDPVIQIAGSSEEYGMVYENEVPIKETNTLRPMSPYGVSKVTQDKLALQYFMSYKLKTIVTRAFNHTGPRRGDVFATSSFAKQIALIEKGKQEKIVHGNLEAKRDFTDVRDMVKAYELAVLKCDSGEEYNICSGYEGTFSIRIVLEKLIRLSKAEFKTEQDPERMRPSDVSILHGDCSKFKEKTGWKPEIPFDKTLEDLLNYWRERV